MYLNNVHGEPPLKNNLKILNNKGQRMDPCGTPVLINLKSDSLTLYLTFCFLFDM